MKKNDHILMDPNELRQQAERILIQQKAKSGIDNANLSPEEIDKILHDLLVHQIELEMQNEELRTTQAGLDAARTRYFMLYDLAPVSYCTLSEQGIVVEANLAMATLFGLQRRALIGKSLSHFIQKEDQDNYYLQRKQLFNTGVQMVCDLRMVRQDHSGFWAHIIANFGQNQVGLAEYRFVISDITERKLNEEVMLFLAQKSSGDKTEPFFNSLARYIAKCLDMDYVCIDRLEGDGLMATTVAVWYKGEFEDNVTYALKDTPCGEVVGKTVCCFPASVCTLFPHDQALQDLNAESYVGVTVFSHTGLPIGLIAVIGQKPLINRALAESTLKLISVRVAGELERLEAEEALKESEERFKALHNASFGGIAIHEHGLILDCNQGLSEMMGYTRDELIMMDGYSLIAEESRQLVLDNVAADYYKPYEAFGQRKNGEIFPIRLEARSIPYKGKIVRSVEFRDLSEQKIAEKKLKDSEEDLTEAQRIAHVGNWRLDAASNEVVWSEELYKMYGFDPSLPPPPYTEHQKLFTKESWDRLSVAVAKTAEIGTPYELELNTLREDGTNGWMWAHGEAIFNDGGKITGLKGVAQDITERKLAEQEKEKLTAQLNQTHKMELLGQLAGGVAHDFNNLLTVIMGYSAELSSSLPLESDMQKDAAEIFKAGTMAKSLTQQLLTLSRKQVIQIKVLDLNELVANLHGMFTRLIAEHIEIVCIPSPQKAMVKADPSQIEQIIMNLVLNSRDAMPKGGKITINTLVFNLGTEELVKQYNVERGKYVLLSVNDSGLGMPQSVQEQIFEPFFTTKEKGSGLGLGLATVYGIVLQSEGRIYVESEMGKGTTFKVLLPYSDEQIAIEQNSILGDEIKGKGEQVLVVDDEEALAAFFKTMITKIGYNVTVAHSGSEAINLIQKGMSPDLVITDVIMPKMNGKELVDKIRQINAAQKVLYMSGFTDNIIQPYGILDNGIPFIQKPFSAPEIAAKLKSILVGDNS